MNFADPARVKPDRRCPSTCPWGTHPENPAWQRCGMSDCRIERLAPVVAVPETRGNGHESDEQGSGRVSGHPRTGAGL